MAELDEDCKAIIKLLDEHLIPNSSQEFEAMVFYHKMKGDYYRYMAEYTLSDAKEGIANVPGQDGRGSNGDKKDGKVTTGVNLVIRRGLVTFGGVRLP